MTLRTQLLSLMDTYLAITVSYKLFYKYSPRMTLVPTAMPLATVTVWQNTTIQALKKHHIYNESTWILFLSKLIKQAPEWIHPHPFVLRQFIFWWSAFVYTHTHTHDNCNERTCICKGQFTFKSMARSILKITLGQWDHSVNSKYTIN